MQLLSVYSGWMIELCQYKMCSLNIRPNTQRERARERVEYGGKINHCLTVDQSLDRPNQVKCLAVAVPVLAAVAVAASQLWLQLPSSLLSVVSLSICVRNEEPRMSHRGKRRKETKGKANEWVSEWKSEREREGEKAKRKNEGRPVTWVSVRERTEQLPVH